MSAPSFTSTIRIDATALVVGVAGRRNAIVAAALEELAAQGAATADAADRTSRIDVLLVSFALLPEADGDGGAPALLHAAEEAATAMAARGGGRIVFFLSSLAALPMRRHPGLSMEAAAALACMRTLAMRFAPKVLVNAIGFGAIGADALVAGDAAMLSHAPLGRAGLLEEAVAAVLFFCDPLNTYTTGQLLSVDGGWAAGYGRDF